MSLAASLTSNEECSKRLEAAMFQRGLQLTHMARTLRRFVAAPLSVADMSVWHQNLRIHGLNFEQNFIIDESGTVVPLSSEPGAALAKPAVFQDSNHNVLTGLIVFNEAGEPLFHAAEVNVQFNEGMSKNDKLDLLDELRLRASGTRIMAGGLDLKSFLFISNGFRPLQDFVTHLKEWGHAKSWEIKFAPYLDGVVAEPAIRVTDADFGRRADSF